MSKTVYISRFYQLKYDLPHGNLTKYESYIKYYLILVLNYFNLFWYQLLIKFM